MAKSKNPEPEQIEFDDKTNMDILVTYQVYLVKQMDVLFSAVAMFGVAFASDKRMIANIKELEAKYKLGYQQFLVALEAIVSPETLGDLAGAREAAAKETSKGDGAAIKTLAENEIEPTDSKPKKT